MSRVRTRPIGVLAVLALVGCSQTTALAPVGGNRLAEVRFAAIDVLLDEAIAIMVAPVCSASGPDDAEITCQGSTADGEPISIESPAGGEDHMVVTVGGRTVYDGLVQAVLTAAARASS